MSLQTMATPPTVAAQFPPVFLPLSESHRYKVCYGGPWTIARLLLLQASSQANGDRGGLCRRTGCSRASCKPYSTARSFPTLGKKDRAVTRSSYNFYRGSAA